MQVLDSFSEFERGMIREHSMTGQQATMLRGIHCGRAKSMSKDDKADLVRLWGQSVYTMDTLAKIFNAHPSSVNERSAGFTNLEIPA